MAKKKNPKSDSAAPVNFEESYAKVEAIVRKLEQGQLGLTESLEHYEQGVKHLKQCYQALEQAEQKIELLTGLNREGVSTTVPFAELEEAADDSGETTSSGGGSLFDDLDE